MDVSRPNGWPLYFVMSSSLTPAASAAPTAPAPALSLHEQIRELKLKVSQQS
jgi:hypothetical protein